MALKIQSVADLTTSTMSYDGEESTPRRRPNTSSEPVNPKRMAIALEVFKGMLEQHGVVPDASGQLDQDYDILVQALASTPTPESNKVEAGYGNMHLLSSEDFASERTDEETAVNDATRDGMSLRKLRTTKSPLLQSLPVIPKPTCSHEDTGTGKSDCVQPVTTSFGGVASGLCSRHNPKPTCSHVDIVTGEADHHIFKKLVGVVEEVRRA